MLFLFFITLMKARGAASLGFEPLLCVYTIFVTTFQLSRLIAAMFYENAYRGSVLARSSNGKASVSGANDPEQNKKFEPSATFVIPCKNEEKEIAETIANCFRADYPKEKIEVIAINDGSTDRSGEIMKEMAKKFENLTVIDWKENQGKKHAMAEGFRRAKGEIVIQLDSDSFIDPATFKKIVEPFQNPEIGAVSAHTDPRNAGRNFLTKMQAAYYFMSFRVLKAAESTFLTVFCCSGCASAYRKSVVLPVLEEWLEETFLGSPVPWGDDRALTSRILKSGYRTIYSNKVKAETIVPETLRQLTKQQIRWKKSWLVNAIYNARFIWKTQPFVAFTYFFPLVGVTYLSPVMAGRAIFFLPFIKGIFPFYHIIGVLLLAAIFLAYYRFVAPENKYWIYYFPWALFNLFFLSFLTIYALIRINDRGWGTR
ncbi:MAG: glycosyltransferase [Patescibacteria group bacterium]|nr:glycosyltransferase [Patescibacteria group bacterium]